MGWGLAAGLAGASLVGDLIQGEENRDAAEEANQRSLEVARENMRAQREFAQHGIRWRVEDAIAAGLHPLAALGSNGANYNPVAVSVMPETSEVAGSFSRFGQNLSRAYQATATAEERTASKLRLENMQLQNDLLRSQISSINSPNNPPMPVGGSSNFVPGQGDSGVMLVKPSERTASQPGRPAQEMGWRPDVGFSRTDTGLVPVIPQGLSESLEDDLVGKILWRLRNQVSPNFGGSTRPMREQLPRGAREWRWDRFKQEWAPIYGGEKSFGHRLYEDFRYAR